MTMNTLLQKLRWIQWGHKPIERTAAPAPSSAVPSPVAPLQRPTTLHVTEVAEDDDDFSNHVMFQRRPNDPHQQRNLAAAEDAMDDDLQLALAISRSQAEVELNNNIHQRPLNIIDPTESHQVAKAKLQTISTHTPNALIKYNIKPLSPSKLQQRSSDTTPYWDLATTTHKQDCTYLSKFLINLHHPSS